MTLTSGSRLGPYEILDPIGAGGMGIVHRARDTRLDRDVAIKVLPDLFAQDPERLARFEREARTLAALNHPNIAHIYGIEESAGVRALVMELVDGPTLQEIIHGRHSASASQVVGQSASKNWQPEGVGGGGIAMDEALHIARQIADALEAAHEQGIIHRDLKPANIKLREDGTVKVLDFGLAKALGPASGPYSSPRALSPASARQHESDDSPTLTRPATAIGMVLGTAAYMSPEQAKGKSVDRRTDIWAFGCVLYEMLTGDCLWSGETVTDVIAAVVTREPDWRRLPPATPPAVHRLLRRCLEKDPRRRLRHMGDAAMEIDDALAHPATGEPVVVTSPPEFRKRLALLGAAALGLAALAAGVAWWVKPPPVIPRPIARFVVPLPAGHLLTGLTRRTIAMSPDGSRFAYSANDGIYVRDLDALEPKRVTGTPAAGTAMGVFFSPDGQWVGFSTSAGLMKVPITGGPPQRLVDAGRGATGFGGIAGATWADDGTIVFASPSGIFRVPAAGGTPQLLFASEPQMLYVHPQILPGGRDVLYNEVQVGPIGSAAAVVRGIDGSNRQVVLQRAPAVLYAESGHLVFARDGRLYAAAFDVASRRTGVPVPLPETPRWSPLTGVWQASYSRTGTLAFVPATGEDVSELVWVTRQGQTTSASRLLRAFSDPRLSPDGRQVALHLQDEANDVWVHDLARGTLTRLTFEPAEDETPVWSPDGRFVAYSATRGSTRGVYRRAGDGSTTAEEQLWTSPTHSHVMDWSPDGQALIVEVQNADTSSDLLLLDLNTRQARPILQSSFDEIYGRFSPDGKWLAYGSNESGRQEVYVQPFPALDARIQVSTDGGGQPVWSRDGRELFYRSPTHVMAAAVVARAPMTFSAPRPLFPDRFEHPQAGNHVSMDVAPDGRFLMVARRAQPEQAGARQHEVHIVLHWFEQVKRMAPAQHR